MVVSAGGRVQVAVIGAGQADAETVELAVRLGRALAEADAIVICGGLGGVMAGVARGAHEAGGTVVGVLPSYARDSGNPHLDIVLPTGLGHARNVLVVAAGEAVIALPGAAGTRSELAMAGVLERPVVTLGRADAPDTAVRAATPQEAVRLALAAARARRSDPAG